MFQELPDPTLAAKAATASAAERALADRERFVPVLKAVERFAAAKGLPVGGKQATLLLAGARELPLDEYKYLLYSPDPLRDAVALARALYAVDPDGLTQYTVSLPRAVDNSLTAEISINVAQREVARVRGLPQHRGLHIYKLLAPETLPPFFGGAPKVQCLGPEVQLLDTYVALCDPARRGDWDDLIGEELALRRVFLRTFEAKLGAWDRKAGGAAGGRRAPGTREGLRKAFLDAARAKFLGKTGRVWLVGPESEAGKRRPACATIFSLREEEAALGRLASDAGVPVHFLVNDPRLVTDRRLRRLTVYVARPGAGREAVLDVYNAGNHEAVPYHEVCPGASPGGETRKCPGRAQLVATAFVQARFLLVEVWTMQLLWKMKAVDQEFAIRQLRALLARYRALGPALEDPTLAFPAHSSHFLGQVESLVVADKRDAARRRDAGRDKQKDGKIAGRRAVPFYPARFAGEPPGARRGGGDAPGDTSEGHLHDDLIDWYDL